MMQSNVFCLILDTSISRDENTVVDELYTNENVVTLISYIFTWQENIPIKEVFENLKCTEEGLSSAEVEKRLNVFGHNKLEEKKVSHLRYIQILFLLWSNSCNLYI